ELRFLSLQSVAFRRHGVSLLGRKPLPVGSQDSCLSRRSQPTYVQGNLNMPDTPERLNNFIYIENSFLYPYNNGCIEGVNNKIKVLNRVAYGYKNFYYFNNRSIVHFKLRLALKQKEIYSKAALDSWSMH